MSPTGEHVPYPEGLDPEHVIPSSPLPAGPWRFPTPPCPAFRQVWNRGIGSDIERCVLPEGHDGDHSPTRPDPEDT